MMQSQSNDLGCGKNIVPFLFVTLMTKHQDMHNIGLRELLQLLPNANLIHKTLSCV